MFKNKRIVYVTDVNVMNEHIKYCLDYKVYGHSPEWVKLQRNPKMYYTLDILYTRLILRYAGNGNYYTEYIFQLDGNKHAQTISGLRAFNLLQRMSNKGVIDLTGNPKYYDSFYQRWKLGNIGGLVYFNDKYMNQRLDNCYEYDMNNAYSWAMEQPMPNTKVLPRMNDIVKDNEIGFRVMQRGLSSEMYLYAVFEKGFFAEYIFPAIESPFKKFVDYYYNKRKKATGEEREKMKQIQNYAIGYVRRKNPFIHSCILSRCRFLIESLTDDNTLYCNTDSIISYGRRIDLDAKIGDNIGNFKIKHTGQFAYTGSGYQWNNEQPSVRGKSKAWFDRAYPNGFDILRDTLPYIEANKYYYDEKKGRIIENGCTETESE